MTEKIGEIIAWPSAALVFGVIVTLLFRRNISALIGRVNEAKLGENRVFKFGQARSDIPKGNRRLVGDLDSTGALAYGKWRNTGNLYWLGHDLIWTMQMALRGAPLTAILHGLQQSLYHTRHLNLEQTPAGTQLIALLQSAASSTEKDWSASRRDEFAYEIELIRNQMGEFAEEQQPDFEADV